MARRDADPVLPCQTTGALLAHADGRGVDAGAVAGDHGFDPGAVGADSLEVGIAERAELFADIAARLGDPEAGVSLAQAMPIGRFRAPEQLALRSPDLRTAIRFLMTRGTEINPLTRFALAEQGAAAVVHHEVGRGLSPGPHVAEFVIAYIVRIGRLVAGLEFPIRYAWFDHPAPASAPRLAAYLGTTDLRFGAKGRGVCFDASVLRVQARPADPAAPPPQGTAGEVPVVARARAALANHDLPVDEAGLARALKMSVRTLRRRLATDGTGYRELREEAILHHARRLLSETDASVEAVGRTLGYGYAANFARSFRRATGMSPAQWRSVVSRGHVAAGRAQEVRAADGDVADGGARTGGALVLAGRDR
jgi:AraC-like DNA-binding protein